MRRALLALAVVSFAFALAAPAQALTDEEARDYIAGLQLSPAMLYPATLPSRIADVDADVSADRGVEVAWDRGRTAENYEIGSISLERADRTVLAENLRISRRRGYRPRRVTIGTRRVWRICGHICGYSWMEAGRSYHVYGIYYVGDEDGQTVDRDLRTVIRSLAPLR